MTKEKDRHKFACLFGIILCYNFLKHVYLQSRLNIKLLGIGLSWSYPQNGPVKQKTSRVCDSYCSGGQI